VRLDTDKFRWTILFPQIDAIERVNQSDRRSAVPAIEKLETGRALTQETFEIAMEYLLV